MRESELRQLIAYGADLQPRAVSVEREGAIWWRLDVAMTPRNGNADARMTVLTRHKTARYWRQLNAVVRFLEVLGFRGSLIVEVDPPA